TAAAAPRAVVAPAERESALPAADAAAETPEPTRLQRMCVEGRWVVSVELDPPRGLNPAKALRGAAMLREEVGVDLINIPDSPMGRARMSALALAYMVQQGLGVETIV